MDLPTFLRDCCGFAEEEVNTYTKLFACKNWTVKIMSNQTNQQLIKSAIDKESDIPLVHKEKIKNGLQKLLSKANSETKANVVVYQGNAIDKVSGKDLQITGVVNDNRKNVSIQDIVDSIIVSGSSDVSIIHKGTIDKETSKHLLSKYDKDTKFTPGTGRLKEAQIGENHILPISFVNNLAKFQTGVCKLTVPIEKRVATGFLIHECYIMTNYHVIDSEKCIPDSFAEFFYDSTERDRDTVVKGTRKLQLPKNELNQSQFIGDKDLDYSIVEIIGNKIPDAHIIRLLDSECLYFANEDMNIIGHPHGNPKSITLRENKLVEEVTEKYVKYTTHTENGNSGSPVFNRDCILVALHTEAGEADLITKEVKYNVGICIDAIVQHIKSKFPFIYEQLFN